MAGRGVPLSGAVAVVLNVIAISSTGTGGYLTLWPDGRPKPSTSNVNFPGKATTTNLCVVPLGLNGKVKIFDGFAPGLHVVADVQGWVRAHEVHPVGPTFALTAGAGKAEQVLATANRYLMDTWWPGPALTDEDGIRRVAMAALGLSLSADPLGRQRCAEMVERVAAAHQSNALDGWGEGWQTPMWAGIAGRATWFAWSAMPISTRMLVARMIAGEADYAARHEIHYLRSAAGTVLTPGDTGAEEVSWWASAMAVALVMLPEHLNAPIWAAEVQRFSVAAWARPQDVAAWSSLIAGSNVESNGQVINHSRVAPDYATCTYQTLDPVVLFALADLPAPEALRVMIPPVYAGLVGLYVPGTAAVTYPQGCDWGIGQRMPYALSDLQALLYDCDSTGQAATYLDLHLDAQLAMQARHADGHTYANTTEYNYIGAEEHIAALAASAVAAQRVFDQGLSSFA